MVAEEGDLLAPLRVFHYAAEMLCLHNATLSLNIDQDEVEFPFQKEWHRSRNIQCGPNFIAVMPQDLVPKFQHRLPSTNMQNARYRHFLI